MSDSGGEQVDVNDNLYSSEADLPVLANFSNDLKLDETVSMSQDDANLSNEIKLGQKEFDENEFQNEATQEAEGGEYAEDDSDMPMERNEEWQRQSQHIFILSEAGKPIYSLHGSEDQLVTFMGLLQALVSIIECDNDNRLCHVVAGAHRIVFTKRSHLILVNVCSLPHICIEQLELQLNYCYHQIVSVVTLSLINKIFARSLNYDLRNKLTGTEKLLTNVVARSHTDFGMLLNCVNSFPVAHETREQISRILATHISPLRYVIFGLLLYDQRLVTLIRPKSKNIHPVDVHLLVNVITGFDALKSAEFAWYPVCLPHFDSNGIMYAYISHLDEACRACLILLSCDQEKSLELNECRVRVQQKLVVQGLLGGLQGARVARADPALRLEQLQIAELKHFLFKDNKVFQYFASEFALPYALSGEQQRRVFGLYQMLYHRLHNKTSLLRIVYMQKKYETILGWVTSNFEIYATFSPLVTKDVAIRAINKLLDFTQRNKTKIFLNAMPTIQR